MRDIENKDTPECQLQASNNSTECLKPVEGIQLIKSDGESDDSESDDSESDDSESDAQSSSICPTIDPLEEDKMRDIKHKDIYVRKVKKFKPGAKSTQQKRKGERIYNSYHSCIFCKKLVQHIRIHLKVKHNDEKRVKEAFYTNESKVEDLRILGDHEHNVKTIENGKGELLLKRRPPSTGKFSSKDYGPCPHCYEWMKKTSIQRHTKKCVKSAPVVHTKRELAVNSDFLCGRLEMTSNLMREEVFTIMTPDNITEVAQSDNLILALGESWLRRNIDNIQKRKYYASQRMRLNARLLIELRKALQNSKLSMWEALTPQNFDQIVISALQVASPVLEDLQDLQAPSNTIKLKYDLKRLINVKWVKTMKTTGEEKTIGDCRGLQRLIDIEWGERVTKLSRSILARRKWNNGIDIPHPEDVKRLTSYVIKALEEYELNDSTDYRQLVQLLQTRLLCYNKRRSGEIDAVRLTDYRNRKVDLADVDRSILGTLSPLEEYLLQSQDLMIVRGKRGRPVPVLIPEDAKRGLDFVSRAEIRQKNGIPETNLYLFGTTGSGSNRSYDAIKATASSVNLDYPERITSVSLRKYTATLTQVLSLKDNELQWVCDHLGHTKKVHLNHYRQMSGVLERVQVAKVLLMADLNITQDFKDKNLSEIQFQDVLQYEKKTNRDEDAEDAEDTNNANEDNQEIENEDEVWNLSDDEPQSKKRKTTRVQWTAKEVKELKVHFAKHLENKTTPKRAEILEKFKKMKDCECLRRSYHLIVKKISAMNHKK